MSYQLDAVTFQADMGPEGMAKTAEIWGDIGSGKLPLMFASDGTFNPALMPVTEYTDYETVQSGGPITVTIRMVSPEYLKNLEARGGFRRYETESAAGSIEECSLAAWEQAQRDMAAGSLNIDYSFAVESTVPAQYAPDGKAHCTLLVKSR